MSSNGHNCYTIIYFLVELDNLLPTVHEKKSLNNISKPLSLSNISGLWVKWITPKQNDFHKRV